MNDSSISRCAFRMPPWTTGASWLRAHPYTVLAFVFFLAMGVPFVARNMSEWDDVFVHAAGNLLSGRQMYEAVDGYLYPPFMAWLSIPFALLPTVAERGLYYAINVVCIVLLGRWAWALSGGRRLQDPATPFSEHAMFLLGLACAFRYVHDGLAHQQVDMIIGWLVMGGCLALSRSRSWLGATAFGLAAAMKCTALLWCPYLIWRKRWLPAGWLVAVAVGVNFLPSLVSMAPDGKPWAGEWLSRYIMPLGKANTRPGTWGSDIIYNQSICGLWNRFFVTRFDWNEQAFDVVPQAEPMGAGTLKLIVYGSEIALLLAALAVCGWRPNREHVSESASLPRRQTLEFSLVLMLMLLLSPMSSKPHFCTLLLPAFCLARQAVAGGSRLAAILLELAIITSMLGIRGIWGDELATFGLWWGCITWSTLLLFAGCWYELRIRNRGDGMVPLATIGPDLAGASGSVQRRAG